MIKVIVVDDHPLFAEGLKSMFKPEDEIEVAGHTCNGNELPSLLASVQADLILMDIDMPAIDGIATMELLREKNLQLPVLMLTMHQSVKQIRRALEKGAQGYILKDAHKSELVEAIKATSQHKNYFHPKINEQLFDYFRGKKIAPGRSLELSAREIEIVQRIAEGCNSREIASKLYLSEHTIKTHRRNIMHKLNVKTSAELIHLVIENGLL